MNTFENFGERWTRMEEEYEFAYKQGFARLPKGDFPFLSDAEQLFLQGQGIPNNAPYFSFEGIEEGLPRLSEQFAEGQIEDEIRKRLHSYRDMGADGGGNPITLDERSRELYFLDHEDGFAPTFLNSSLEQFVEFLVQVQQAEVEAPDADLDALARRLREIDPKAVASDSYWLPSIADLNDVI